MEEKKKVVVEEEIIMGPMEEMIKTFYELDLEKFYQYLEKEKKSTK